MDDEVRLLASFISDISRQFGISPEEDIATLSKLAARGSHHMCAALKERDDEIVTAMILNTRLKPGLFSQVYSVSPPSSHALAGFLSKFDDGLVRTDLAVKCESATIDGERKLRSKRTDRLALAAISAFADMHLKASDEPSIENLLPCHGPGAVFEARKGRSKWAMNEITGLNELDDPSWLPNKRFSRMFAPTARFFAVPKDSVKMRGISVEPCLRQYFQQGLRRLLMDHIHKDLWLRKHLPLKDQTFNMRASSARGCATIDLSNASDSVRCSHVYTLFKNWPNVRRLAFGVRSPNLLTSEGVIPLTRYAGMGNASTFVIESLLFLAIVEGALRGILEDKPSLYAQVTYSLYGCLVYGDDIVIPDNAFAADVVSYLDRAGYSINTKKTAISGPYKESCGAEWYNGMAIDIPKLRKPLADLDGPALTTVTSRLRSYGAQEALEHIFHALRHDPYAQESLFGKHNLDLHYRYDSDKQRMLVRYYSSENITEKCDDKLGLYQYFTTGSANMITAKCRNHVRWRAV
jgi:hypothetical protein